MNKIYGIHDKQHDYERQYRQVTDAEAEETIKIAAEYKKIPVCEIRDLLDRGLAVSFGETANYYYTHDTKKIRIQPEPKPEPALVKCSCGHSVKKGLVMGTSTGSSCQRCYDRMSM